MISSSYKLYQYDNLYNLYTDICINTITISNSLVITSSYKYCITYIRLSIVRRIRMRPPPYIIRILCHIETNPIIESVLCIIVIRWHGSCIAL